MGKYIRIQDFHEIYKYHIIKRCFEHDEISFYARLTKEESREWDRLQTKPIRADIIEGKNNRDQGAYDRNLFIGSVDSFELSYDNSWYCDVTAKSFSASMDLETKSRIFQDPEKTLYSIIKTICDEYENVILKEDGTENISVPDPVIQYEETDWQFLLRLAAKYGFYVIVDADEDNAAEGMLWFGGINRKTINLDSVFMTKKIYSKTGNIFKFRSQEIFEIGDKVCLNGTEYQIIQCDFYMENCAFVREYTISQNAFKSMEAPDLNGIVLMGTVKNLEGEGAKKGQIQVSFDLEKDEPFNYLWIDWATSYGDKNAGIYDMPSVGELVCIHVLDASATRLLAERSIRSTDLDRELKVTDKLIRVGDKEILIADEKLIIKNNKSVITLEGEKINIQTVNGSLDVSADGMDVKSEALMINTNGKDVTLDGGKVSMNNGDVTMKTGKVTLNGDDITLTCGDVTVKCGKLTFSCGGETTITSSKIKLNGKVEVM